ncbi:MAG: hypothetical protein RLZZ57_151 [Pseudomonadota bacterium]|jgi:uncharacterized protein involved in outer membrane biogenesis
MPASALKPARRWPRYALGTAALVFLLLIGGIFALRAALESGRFTPRIQAEIENATGYRASIGGLGLTLGLIPKLELRDVTLSTPDAAVPGLVAPRLAASVSLFSLFGGGLEIPGVEAEGLKLNLDPKLWALPEAAKPSRPARSEAAAPKPPGAAPLIGLISLTDSVITLPGGPARQIQIPRLSISHLSASSASDLAAVWRFNGIDFTLAGQAGPLLGTAPGALPPLGALTLKAGAGDLGWLLPGLRLDGLELVVPPEAEARLTGAISRGRSTARLEARLGALGKLVQGASAPLPIEARLAAGNAHLSLKGAVARPLDMAGGQFDLVLEVPDGAALAGFFAAPSGLSGAARLEWRDTAHFSLPHLQLTSPAMAASAALNLGVSGRPNLAGRIEITKLDLDALAPPAPAPTTPGGVAPSAPAAAGDGRIIPDIALPVALLMALDAEVKLALSGFSFRNLPRAGLQTDMRLKDGALALAPFNLSLPSGQLAGQVTVNAAANPAQYALSLRSEGAGLELSALSGALSGLGLAGNAEIAADLRGAGASTRAVAASLDGAFGLALANGRLEQGVVMDALGAVLRLLSPNAQRLGVVELRCLAIAFAAEQGVAQSRALFTDSGIGQINGQARINLRDESLDGRLNSNLRVFGLGLRAPVNLGGTLAAPRLGAAPAAALGQNATGLITDALTGRIVTEPLGNLLGENGRNAAMDCAEPLRIARLGAEGAIPAPRPAPEAAPGGTKPSTPAPVQDLLRGLGGILGGGRR